MAETSKKSEDVEVAECQGCAVPRCCWCVVLTRTSGFSGRRRSEVRQHGSLDLVEIYQMSSWTFVGNLEKERGRRGGRVPGVRGPSVLLVRGVECEFLDFPADSDRRSDSTNRISSTSSSDPCGRGRDRGGLTAK